MALVQLGRLIVDSSLLAPDQAGQGAPELLDAVRRCEQEGGFGEPFDADGWRVLLADQDDAVVAAWSDSWSGWVVLKLRRRSGSWKVRGSSYGVLPTPTPSERGAGLRLRWADEPIHVRRGRDWQLQVELVNDGAEPADVDGESSMAFGHLTKDGKELPTEPLFVGGMGLRVRLKPGRSVLLPVALFTSRPERLPAGDYELHAHYESLGLTAPVVTLHVGSGGRPAALALS